MMDNKSAKKFDIKSVQTLLLGENNELVTSTIKKDSKKIVSDVIAEAIQERQAKDGGISAAIAPIMESAITKSIATNKATFIDAMYPVVGGLVRKSVTSFFNGFLEKLNHLIEYSFTLKGLKWRLAAWRKGVPFTQYILQKTFVYHVENMLLIHRQSGTLLLDVASEHTECHDPALTSAMLTAINDFMADSFNYSEDVVLDTIKTHERALLVASSPSAILVAAVSGIIPNDFSVQLQKTLDDIHLKLSEELQQFDGDTASFTPAEPLLRECLLSEINTEVKTKTPPYLAFVALTLFCLPVFIWGVNHWQNKQIIDAVYLLEEPAGILLQSASIKNRQLVIRVMRDPAAISIEQWLADNFIDVPIGQYTETPFISLADEIRDKKVATVLAGSKISYVIKGAELSLTADPELLFSTELQMRLLAIPGIENLDTQAISLTQAEQIASHETVWGALKNSLLSHSVTFNSQSVQLTAEMTHRLDIIAQQIQQLVTLSKDMQQQFGVVITGFSDNTGNQQQNLLLSQQRAEQVKQALLTRNIPSEILHAVGVGEIPFAALKQSARSVTLTVIEVNTME